MKSLIPNGLTSLNLACGILSMILLDPLWSPTLILVSALADVFDGAVARYFKVDGEFGLQLDSLADLVSFGIAPAYIISMIYLDNVYLQAVITILAGLCAAWRLAKFNTLEASKEFSGLPSPAHGLFLTGIAFGIFYEKDWQTVFPRQWTESSAWEPTYIFYLTIASMIIFSLLMISKFKFFSFKSIRSSRKTQILMGIIAIVTLTTLIFFPAHFLWVGIAIYTILSILT